MLFRKDIPRKCAYCARALRLDAADLLCRKFGVVGSGHSCRKFKYDPTKRLPPAKMNLDTSLDFKIEP